MPSPYSNNPYAGQSWGSYFLPGFTYGQQLPGMENSLISDYLQRQNFQIAYDYWSQGAGLSPNGAFANFVRSQQPLIERAYNAALVPNPDLTPQQFLGSYLNGQNGNPGLTDTFNSMSYQQRGENPSAWGQGRSQWVRRNN